MILLDLQLKCLVMGKLWLVLVLVKDLLGSWRGQVLHLLCSQGDEPGVGGVW